ncbi:hypothetical protein RHGRI_038643 [Rhododendron griersonianum]|uniref:Uncharacterized protein n=1 Tax=Rhododendron griersonianum TaxID=479676 RepID=A0AAV6HJI0_9ERIC|nr:hypothetical protein RHGRI_038643 [Rhododendron griersonianum]
MPSDPLPADKDGGDESKPSAVKETDEAKKDDAVSSIQKKIRRAEQFRMPVQLSEEENRNSRAESHFCFDYIDTGHMRLYN